MKTIRIELDLTPKMIDELRWLIDGLPICTYAPLIMAVLPKLPFDHESAAGPPLNSAGADPAPVSSAQESGGFSLHALTPKGERLMPEIARILGRLEVLPHGGSL
jgi:hypothetical protein